MAADNSISNERLLSILLSLLGAILVMIIYSLIVAEISSAPSAEVALLLRPLTVAAWTVPLSLPFIIWLIVRKLNNPKKRRFISNWNKVLKSTLKGAFLIAIFFLFLTKGYIY